MDEGWPEEAFTEVGRAEQRAALVERGPLTGTKWDALLAAMVEHVAWLHGHERPAWVDEPERFLDATWVVADTPWTRLYSVIDAEDVREIAGEDVVPRRGVRQRHVADDQVFGVDVPQAEEQTRDGRRAGCRRRRARRPRACTSPPSRDSRK